MIKKPLLLEDFVQKAQKDGSSNEIVSRGIFSKLINVRGIIKKDFPDYKEYIVIQYGSSTQGIKISPNDYDYIVLMLGYSTEDTRQILLAGSDSEIYIVNVNIKCTKNANIFCTTF